MIKNQIKSFLKSNKLPFNIVKSSNYCGNDLLLDDLGNQYLSVIYTLDEYLSINEMYRFSSSIKKPIYELIDKDNYILFYDFENKTEEKVKAERTLEISYEIFEKSSYEIKLKKQNLINLNNIYKVLDDKFNYFEMRIREIETSPLKNDVSWIVLSKYNIILDAKIYLYDLQQDLFKMIDKEETIKYGIIIKGLNSELYFSKSLLINSNIYYGPMGMLLCRLSLSNIDLNVDKLVKKCDSFNQKYYLFMTLYILILSINMEIVLDTRSIANYLAITKKIKSFLMEHKELLEK